MAPVSDKLSMFILEKVCSQQQIFDGASSLLSNYCIRFGDLKSLFLSPSRLLNTASSLVFLCGFSVGLKLEILMIAMVKIS